VSASSVSATVPAASHPVGGQPNVNRGKDGDATMRSVWLCSRNDAIGNMVVIVAAAGVWETGTAWPDLGVGGLS